MISTIIKLDDDDDRMLKIIKANLGHKNKSQTISYLIQKNAEEFLKVRPEYLKKLEKIRKGPHTTFKSMEEFDFIIKNGRRPTQLELSEESAQVNEKRPSYVRASSKKD